MSSTGCIGIDRQDAAAQADLAQWLEHGEQRRILLVAQYYWGSRQKAPQLSAYVIVENQQAEGLAPVVRAMECLQSEGLSRHDAIHAIGSVPVESINDLVTGKIAEGETQAI